MTQKFYYCKHCGNILAVVRDQGVPVFCCGENMQEITPNTSDAAQEKHVPVLKKDGSQVTVHIGSVEHPMTPEHYIEWICLQTQQGSQIKKLEPGNPPQACFALCEGDHAEAAYAFCNLHGLWNA